MKFDKIFKWLKLLIDLLGKNAGRVKTIGMVVLAVLFLLSMVKNGIDQKQIAEMVEQITGLDVRNELLAGDIDGRDSVLTEKERRIQNLTDMLGDKDSVVEVLESRYGRLKAENKRLADSLSNVPTDSSYRFLVDEAYPYPGHLKYRFNEPQVKGIHHTFLEKIKVDEMNLNLLSQINEKDYQLEVKDTIVYEQGQQIELMAESRKDQDSIIVNQDGIIEVQKKQIKKQRQGKTIWQVVSGTFLAIIAVLLAAG